MNVLSTRPELEAGGAFRAPSQLTRFVWGVLAVSSVLFVPSVLMAQTPMPEQKLSTDIWLHHFDPQIRATGHTVFGVWGGGDTPPHQIDAASSLDGGASWTSDTSLPPVFGEFGARMPFALDLNASSRLNLMTQNPALLYYGSPSLAPSSWSEAVIVDDGSGYLKDARAIGSATSGPFVFFAYTELGSAFANYLRFMRSLDNGGTWSAPVALAGPNCNGSSLVVGPDETIFVGWLDYALGRVLLRKSTDHGATFAPAVAVAPMLDNLNGWAVGWRTPYGIGNRYYPYYHESVASSAAAPNFPSLAVDRSSGPTRGWLYLVWADLCDGSPAPITSQIAEIEPNHDPGNLTGDFSLAQAVPLDCEISGLDQTCCDGAVHDADWYAFDGVAGATIVLDGDSFSSTYSYANLFLTLPTGERLPLTSVTFPGSTQLAAGAHAKPAIVTLPRTGRYAISAGGGSYRVRLRHWNVAPNSLARDMRDIVLVRSTDGGATWSPKVRVNHDGPGADQSQPNVAVDEQGRVYVAWYDRRGSALGNTVRPYASVSTDGGQTFGPDMPLSSVASEWIRPSAEPLPDWTFPGNMIGDRIALAAGDDYGMAAWTDLRAFPVASVYGARLVDIPTAVTAVSDLVAEPLASGAVRLRWHVNDARGLSAVEVVRREGDGDELLVGAATLSGAEGEAWFEDASAEPGHAYDYRLRVTAGGRVDYLGPVTIAVPARITALACRATGANPFAERAALTLAVPRAESGVVRVYDVQGKVVRTLREGRFEPGELRLEWDGRDAAGAETAPGLYFVSAQVGGESARAKLTRVR